MTVFSATRRSGIAALLTLAFTACGSDNPSEPSLVAPTNVQATAAGGAVTVTWSAVAGADAYLVQRATGTTGGTFVQIGDAVSGTTLIDNSVVVDQAYRYRVAARLGAQTGPFSTDVTVGARQAVVEGNLTASRRLFSDTLYILKGFVKVADGATLTIDPGTKIVGDTLTPGSALFVLRGGRIVANGTVQEPIVFTSARADGNRAPGDWGGLIIVGNASTNRTGAIVEGSNANVANGGPPGIDYTGGTVDDDSSGVLRYVRVEYAGFGVAQDAELNSFTLAAVGSRTKLEYLQALLGLDDHFEWFGGTVDAKYLVSYESGDDHFDASEGYRGRNQFLIGLQTFVPTPRPGTGQASSDPQGFEVDGCAGTGCADGQNSVPFNMPVYANFTMIGPGPNVLPPGGGVGMVLRRGTGGTYVNGVVGRYPMGLSVRDANTDARRQADSLTLSHILFANNTVDLDPSTTNFTQPANFTGANFEFVTTPAHQLFAQLPPAGTLPSTATLDWTPATGSILASGGLDAFTGVIAARSGTFITATSYRGAADPNGAKWWSGWTIYDRN
ncbi:MAG TPA: fibronectin type III domain-containing protein [Gemmatimonadaceae bacterium]|nr:fibronectin type III domain-containing protein [Gemmatimonadaceae bacterium]